MSKCKEHVFAVCAYKESPYLETCLQSLKQQSILSDILLVTSTPCDFIRDIADKYGIPYAVNTGEGGITQDWNFAYSCVYGKYKYITIAHQDDVYDSDYLETALQELGKSKHPLIFFSNYYEIRDGRKVTSNRLLQIKRLMLLPLRMKVLAGSIWIRRRILSFGSPICCPSVTFVANHLPEIIFENHFRACEDWEAWEKLSRLKGDFVYSPKMLMGHRIHEGSETSAIIGDRMRTQEEYEMFCKFWPKWIAGIVEKFYSKGQNSNNLE